LFDVAASQLRLPERLHALAENLRPALENELFDSLRVEAASKCSVSALLDGTLELVLFDQSTSILNLCSENDTRTKVDEPDATFRRFGSMQGYV
jgi:hypothetical protein